MINFRLLRVFHTVAHTHSVVQAAERLFISQPAVSSTLKKLQQELGIELFKRSGRNLILTHDGESVLQITDQIFLLEKKIEKISESAGQTVALRLGMVALYERTVVADIVERLQKIAPGVNISIHSGNTRSLLEEITNGNIDIALAGEGQRSTDVRRLFYRRHEIYLIVPQGHRLFYQKQFSPHDIDGENFVLKEKGSSVRTQVNSFMKKFGIAGNVISELSNFDSMLNIMLEHSCISFFPDAVINEILGNRNDFATLSTSCDSIGFSTYVYLQPLSSYPPNLRDIIDRISEAVIQEAPV